MKNLEMRYLFLVLLLVGLLTACGKKPATVESPKQQTLKQMPREASAAAEALKRLQLKTEVGINFRDYTAAVSDTLYQVLEYIKSEQGKGDGAINNAIRSAAADHLLAVDVWRAKINDTYLRDDPQYTYGSLSVDISIKYKDFVENDDDWLKPDNALQMIWKHAGQEVAKLK